MACHLLSFLHRRGFNVFRIIDACARIFTFALIDQHSIHKMAKTAKYKCEIVIPDSWSSFIPLTRVVCLLDIAQREKGGEIA